MRGDRASGNVWERRADDENNHCWYRWFARGDYGRIVGVDEAISRAVPLRLVSVIKPTHPSPDLRMLKDRFGSAVRC